MSNNKKGLNPDLSANLAKYFLAIATLTVMVFFGITQAAFFKVANILNILSSACLSAMIGISLTCSMAAGEFDISVGSQLTMGAIVVTKILTKTPINNYWVACILTLMILACIGLVNAFVHVKLRIPAFIATMGTSYILDGVGKFITGGANILGAGKRVTADFTFLGQGYLFGVIPMPVVVMTIIGISMLILTERTRFGKYLYAVGANGTACRYIGIDAGKVKTIAFVLGSVLAGITGIVQSSMLNGVTAGMGDSMLLYALIVMMLGATFLRLGVYNVPGTLVGAILIAVISNGMTMMGAKSYMKDFVQAGILLLACAVVARVRRRSART